MVGYLLEELRDKNNYAEFERDCAKANIFIASLIFIEELADKAAHPPTTRPPSPTAPAPAPAPAPCAAAILPPPLARRLWLPLRRTATAWTPA